jgi:hypothetical protein
LFFFIHFNSFIYHRNIAVLVNLLKITLVVKRYFALIQQKGGATRYVLVIIGHESATLSKHPLLPLKDYTPQPQIILPLGPGRQPYGAYVGQAAIAWPTANIKTTAASAFFIIISFTCDCFLTAKIPIT